MFGSDPRVLAAYRISPGRLFASEINPGNAVTPSEGLTAITIGCSPMNPIGINARSRSTGNFVWLCGSDAARAGTILDIDLLSPAVGETLRDNARDHVWPASGSRRRDDPYR